VRHSAYINHSRYLNIWTPDKGQPKKPVLVFIYGGGFETGTTAGMDGSRLANRGDAVVVIPAYGFASLHITVANSHSDIVSEYSDSQTAPVSQTKI
jgi:carboxylesterase type B